MRPLTQRIKIAEACGWRCIQQSDYAPFGKNYFVGLNPNGAENFQKVPDYLNDLNAMHEVEKVLNESRGGDYDSHLWLIIQRDKTRPASWHATAEQRAEAFLKTLNLWITD